MNALRTRDPEHEAAIYDDLARHHAARAAATAGDVRDDHLRAEQSCIANAAKWREMPQDKARRK